MASAAGRLAVHWQGTARRAYNDTIARIFSQDRDAAAMVAERVDRSLDLLSLYPSLGTPSARPGIRFYAIPNTGHFVEYILANGELRILRWARQRRKSPP